ncbi:MAG TPA: tyrosine-type recombinase/integrase [bacterium]|nr:tyrosine-type recombinase/integrase [bacterium]
MSVYKRNNKYWIAFRYNRQRYRKASPDNSYAGAKAFEALLRQRLAKGEPIELAQKKEIKIPNFQDFSDKWMKTYVATNNKPSEQGQKKCMINKHLIPFFGRAPLNKISAMQIEEFKSKKQSDGLSNKSINNILGILGKCLKTAQEWEIIDKIPKIKPLKVAPKDPVYLNENDYNRLLEQAKNKGLFYEMLLFTLRTGVRIGELLALEWPDIDFNERVVTIKRNIVNGYVGSPKNNKYRRVYLANDLFNILSARRKNKGLIFPDINGNYQSRSSCRHRLERLCSQANLKKLGWHGLRHSFASQLATNGVSLKTIQELLGHSDLKMVQRYAHLEPVTLKEAIRTLEPKAAINLNYGHNMATISKEVKIEKVFQSLENS